MGSPSKRLVVFLCLIVLHQDLVIARTHYNELLLGPSSRIMSPTDTDNFSDGDDESLALMQKDYNITLSPSSPLNRDKRLFGLLLFIVSVVVTVVATTVETIYDIHGCCGLSFDYLCSFEAKFKRRQDDIKAEAEKVDARLKTAITKKDELECLSKVFEALWTEIKRLVVLQEKFLSLITPKLLESVIRKEKQIEKTIKESKEEVDKDKVDGFIGKLEEPELAVKLSIVWSAALLPGGIRLGRTAYKSFKINRLYKTLKGPLLKAAPKAQKLLGFTEGSAKVFVKGVAKMRLASKVATMSKGMKVLKVGGWFMSALSIALDIFSTVSIIMGCDNKVDEAKKAMSSLDKPAKEVKDMENQVIEFEATLQREIIDKLIPEIRKKDFHDALTHIKETIECLPEGQRTWGTRECVDTIIPDALKLFAKSKDYVLIKEELKNVVDNCVSPLKYAYECLISKLEVRNYILDGCRAGNEEFEKLFNDGERQEHSTLDKCIKDGEPYSTEEGYRATLEKFSEKEGFFIPCRLNNVAFKEEICDKRKNGKSAKTISREENMDKSDIKKIFKKCKEGDDYLSAGLISDICQFKRSKWTPEDIASYYEDEIPAKRIEQLQCETNE